MRIDFRIDGATELDRNLATLPDRVQMKVVRSAVRIAQKPALDKAKRNAMSRVGGTMGGLIAENLILRASHKQPKDTYSMLVRMRRQNEGAPDAFWPPKTKAGVQHYIPSAIEFGHGADKASAARPFIRPAVDATIEETKRILAKEMGAGILREAIKGRYK